MAKSVHAVAVLQPSKVRELIDNRKVHGCLGLNLCPAFLGAVEETLEESTGYVGEPSLVITKYYGEDVDMLSLSGNVGAVYRTRPINFVFDLKIPVDMLIMMPDVDIVELNKDALDGADTQEIKSGLRRASSNSGEDVLGFVPEIRLEWVTRFAVLDSNWEIETKALTRENEILRTELPMKGTNLVEFGRDSMFDKSTLFSTPSKAFGIDLGTTNSCIAVLEDGNVPKVIALKSGKKTMPSCVMWKGGDEFVVGDEAYANSDKPNVAYSMKRMMGTDETLTLKYRNKERVLTPVEFSTLVLKTLVEEASEMYKNIHNVVITVPAHFNNKEIEDTLLAGKQAGLNVMQIMREPTAAALLYDTSEKENKILVYDLGGGTFDVSLVEIYTKDTSLLKEANRVYGTNFSVDGDKANKVYNVKKNDGDMRLGGDDIDKALVNIMLTQITQSGYDVQQMPQDTKEYLRLQAESIKKLGSFLGVDVTAEYKEVGTGKHVKCVVKVSDADLKRAVHDIYKRSKVIMQSVLQGETAQSLDAITLVGGSTKSAILKRFLMADFPAIHVNDSLNPDEAVALGAAIQAHRLLNKDESMSIQDITPIAIGVDACGKMKHLIEKNTKLPFSRVEKFTTTVDNQKSISVNVYQGNTILLDESVYLGTIEITDLEPRPAGEPEIFVTLKSDSNGLLYCVVTVDNKTVTKELKNLLGASSEQKKLSPKERRLLVWKRRLENTADEEIRKNGLELLKKAEDDDKEAMLELTKMFSSMAIKDAGLK